MEFVRLSIDEDRDIVPLGLAGGLSSTACSIACPAARWRRVATIVVFVVLARSDGVLMQR